MHKGDENKSIWKPDKIFRVEWRRRNLNLCCPHFCRDTDNSASTRRRNHKGRQKPTAKYNKDLYSRQEVTCVRKRKLPLQKPFKPDGVNRERRTGRENTRCISAGSHVHKVQFHLWGFTRSHTLGSRGAHSRNWGSLKFSPDNNDTLKHWQSGITLTFMQ